MPKGAWRAEGDENANWNISVKTESYGVARLFDFATAVLSVIENSPVPVTIAEIVDHLAVNGAPFGDRDLLRRRNYVASTLETLNRKALVRPIKLKGSRIRWESARADSMLVKASSQAPSTIRKALTDDEWLAIRPAIPVSARRYTMEAGTRAFIEAVADAAISENPASLSPGQVKRYVSWHIMGIWVAISNDLPWLTPAIVAWLQRNFVVDNALSA